MGRERWGELGSSSGVRLAPLPAVGTRVGDAGRGWHLKPVSQHWAQLAPLPWAPTQCQAHMASSKGLPVAPESQLTLHYGWGGLHPSSSLPTPEARPGGSKNHWVGGWERCEAGQSAGTRGCQPPALHPRVFLDWSPAPGTGDAQTPRGPLLSLAAMLRPLRLPSPVSCG